MEKVNVDKLRGKIVENRTSVRRLSAETGIPVTTLYRRLKTEGLSIEKREGPDYFTLKEVNAIAEALCLTFQEKSEIFFPLKVSPEETYGSRGTA